MNRDLSELKLRHERLTLLYEISKVIHSTLEPQETLQHILDEALRAVNAVCGCVALLNPTSVYLEIHAARNLPPAVQKVRLRLGEGVAGLAARKGRPLRVGDVASDHRLAPLRPDLRSELAVPLEVNGETRGVLSVASDRPNAFTAEHQALLEEVAVLAARAIYNSWVHEQFRLKLRLFESLVSVSRAINSTFSLDEALRVITREACALMRAKVCSLMLLDESKEWLELRASYGAGEDYRTKPRLSVEDSLLGIVVRRRKALQEENVQTSSRYQNIELARREGLVSLLSVPLLFARQPIGALSVYTEHAYTFSNEEVRILSALADLSAIAIEKARLYERIVTVEEELRRNEKLSALGLLAAEVAHEIRNPLTVMKMLYHSLELNFEGADPRAKDAQILGEKIEHLNKIVEQILDFARTAEPQFAPVNLLALFEELSLLVRHKLHNQSVRLHLRPQPELPPVRADATQLEQVFLNLILNAAEAMPTGGDLTIRLRAEAPFVVVELEDTGHGIPEARQPQAFQSVFSTTKKKGTGLGLAIVHRIIEAHHGEVTLASQPGRGTLVTVRLPSVA